MKGRFLFLVVGLSLVGLLGGGCHAPMSKTSMGMGIGAAGGALMGQIIGNSAAGILIGVGTCALLGGVYGNHVDKAEKEYMDQQRWDIERLRQQRQPVNH